ncbi:MAG: outer membrane beta-barrel protein [Bdellovibrionales bacterium]|nr:outer membrane beta-barrel protein [Bdellovibrionales bacterium]
MKKLVLSAFVVTAVSSMAIAQEATTASNQAPAATVNVTTVSNQELVNQPTTIVSSTPLTLSRAEQMRKAREQQEVETEQKIVETLEASRLEAEAKRQQEILGNIGGKKEVSVQATAVAAPVVVAAPVTAQPVAAPVVEVQKSVTIDDVRSAVREELTVKNTEVVVVDPLAFGPHRNYITGTVGTMNYDSPDINPVIALGLNFGRLFEERWAAEIRTGYASAYVDDTAFLYRDMNQFSLGLGAKVNILTGRIRPVVGFDVDYVYRSYSEMRDSASGFPFEGTELNSYAIDYAFMAGLDVALSRELTLGFEYRYVSNMTYKFDNEIFNTPTYRNAYGYWVPLEGRDSSTFGFLIKYVF